MKSPRVLAVIIATAALAIAGCGSDDDDGGGGNAKKATQAKASGNVTWCIGKDTTGAFSAMVKQFNDLNGHPAGDSHLKEAASLWRNRLRSADLIARYGGEEFAVLLTATDTFQAREVIETLRGCMPREETVSAGIAQWDGAESSLELIARADSALYEAKRSGRDRTVLAHRTELTPA